MTFGSLFAGMGGFDLAFERAGMTCAWQVECDPDALRVLAKHWPDVKRGDDVRKWKRRSGQRVDIVCGGFPCHDLSVAGKRAGLTGERSSLFWEMLRIVDEFRPEFLVWENVPGLLSSVTAVNPAPDGPDGVDAAGQFDGPAPTWLLEEDYCFEAVLCGLRDIGYFGAWRVLDAQFFGVPQRRRRVFGVFACVDLGEELAAEVLALTKSGGRNPKARRQAGQGVAATIRSRSHSPGVSAPGRGGEDDQNLVILNGHHPRNEPDDPLVAFEADDYQAGTFAETNMARPLTTSPDRTRAAPIVAFQQNQRNEVRETATIGALPANPGMKQQTYLAFGGNNTSGPIEVATACNACGTASGRQDFESETFLVANTIRASDGHHGHSSPRGDGADNLITQDVAFTLKATHRGVENAWQGNYTSDGKGVRRLMPIECLRLQGFPDNWLDLDPPLSDSAMYRMIGNAVAVPTIQWLGRRIVELRI